MSLPSGLRLGPYQIVQDVGAGGMGEVYRARDERLGRDVALKVLPAVLAADPDRRRRFEREARAVAALSHPNVVVIHDVGEGDGVAFIVTELLEGETLRERLRRGLVPAELAADWGASVAEALAAAHEHGIVHRDVKPENLFLTREGRVKVLDFGLAKELAIAAGGPEDVTQSSPTRSGMVLGTLGYLSPEQARGEPIDGRSDIFSLGCVLYEAVTACRAFGGRTAQDLIAAVLKDDPPDALALRAGLPVALARVIQRCLAKQPVARFQSASDLAFALRSIAQSTGMPVAPAPRQSSPARWLPGLGLALAGLLAGYWIRPAVDLPEPNVLALTPGTGREASPAISPDGKFVAYLASDAGRTDVFVKFVAGGPAVNLTATSGLEIQSQGTVGGLEISPDGSVIAVQAGPPAAPRLQRGIWLIPAPLGGPPRKLVAQAAGLRWSVEGSRVAYVRSNPAGGDAIVVARADGAEERVVLPAVPGTHAHEPAWSADGAWIYFDRGPMGNNGAPCEIWRVPSGGGTAEPVLPTQGVAAAPLPTPDGRGLIYAGDQAGSALNLWWRPLGGGRERRLTRGAGDYLSPRISRDGRRLVCEARTSSGSLRRLDLKAPVAGPGEVFTGAGNEDAAPSTSKSGRIAFSSARNGTGDIWISEADGGNPRPLTADAESDSRPSISPDGSRVAFVSNRGGRRGLWLVPAEGGAPRSLLTAEVLDRPSWSPDGRRLVYTTVAASGQAGLWIVSAEGGEPAAIPGVTGRAPAWSPSSDLIAYFTSEKNELAVRFTSSRGEPRLEHLHVPTASLDTTAFSWDGRRLAIGNSPGLYGGAIVVWDLDRGVSRTVDLGPFTGVRGVAWSADDTRLVYGLVQHQSRVLLFDGVGY